LLAACSPLAFPGMVGNGVYERMDISFPDPEWRSGVLRLLATINTKRAQANYVRPKSTLEENDLADICAALATGEYRAEKWFQPGIGHEVATLRTIRPPIDPKSEYRLVALAALRETISRISMRFGGIAFEDPFYALLGCFNVGEYSKLWLLPKVASVDQAWLQRSAIVDSLANGAYAPEKLFFQCDPVGQNLTGLPLAKLTVRGELLNQIHQVGRGSIQSSIGFSRYVMFEFAPAPSP